MTITGRRILITGAASGIGRAVAEILIERGAAALILVDRDAAALASMDLPGTAVRLVGDVADESFWTDAASALGGIDGAVVNAGIAGAGAIVGLAFAEWRRIMAVNLDGAFLTLRAAMRAMKQRGGGGAAGGAIVAVASATGIKAEAGTAAYGASKAALIQLARIAANEGARDGIRVNTIAPGGVETPVWDAVPAFAARAAEVGRSAAFAEIAAAATPSGRFATPADIARQIAFLLSDDARTITGAVLTSDGGYTL